jgi:hypothetical protein
MYIDEGNQRKERRFGEILAAEKRFPKPWFDCGGQVNGIVSGRGPFFTGSTLLLPPGSAAHL